MEKKLEIGILMAKYLTDELTAEERVQFNDWLSREGNDQVWKEISDKEYTLNQLARVNQIKQKSEEHRTKLKSKLYGITAIQKPGNVFGRNRQRYVAAASVCLLISAGIYLWHANHGQEHVVTVQENKVQPANDAAPGQFKAKLMLADGSVIVLDSAAPGKMAQQGNIVVINKGGQLVYQPQQGQGQVHELIYNTLTTTKGETYATTLSDGSKVWLNSQSSIRHPVAFVGNERSVEITGEAYFEVAATYEKKGSKRLPFIVSVNGMQVEVLGTHFNINAYADEEGMQTTLLEGKVKVISGPSLAVLQPGQQAILRRGNNAVKIVKDANVEQAVAWKNGLFMFSDDDIRSVMRQLARWYDLDVVYSGSVPTDTYSGNFPRNLRLAEVLTILAKSDVHFKVEGKQLILSP